MMSELVDLNDTDRQQIQKLALELSKEIPPAEAIEMLGTFGYFRCKAGIYLRKGPEAYRRDDFFSVPRSEWTANDLSAVERAFRQIVDWRGLTTDEPLKHINLAVLYRVVEITHFQFETIARSQSPEGEPLAVVSLLHRVDGRKLRICLRLDRQSMVRCRLQSFKVRRFLPFLHGRVENPVSDQPATELYGYHPECPIVCSDPWGERSFIRRLRCPNGHSFFAKRVGSFSGFCPDPETHSNDVVLPTAEQPGCIVDRYDLCCREGEHRCRLFFDMYHHGFALQPAPAGLSLAPPDDEQTSGKQGS